MPPRRRLVLRVYAFAAVLSIAIMVALLTLPRYVRGARYLEPQAALLQYNVERWSAKDPPKLTEIMGRVQERLRGELSLFDAGQQLVRTTIDPPLSAPTTDEISTLRSAKWALSPGRIVVRSDDGSMFAVYAPRYPGYPWGTVLPICAGLLVLVGAASFWFARRLAQPLESLAVAARAFGAGDVKAHVKLDRNDELGDVGRAFDDMAERTAAVLQSQRQLMADVSHELRTPLARIRVALELVADDPVAAQDVLADVGTDLDEIDQLIGDILTTARLDGDTAKITKRPAETSDVAREAAERFAARHPTRTLETTITERPIDCDPLLLRRALDNLLDNAAKYSDASSPVRLAVVPNGKTVAFQVEDRGIGMSAEELDHAFTPFWRADSSRTRKTGGVGLGLALARRIARAHGGDVTLTSAPGQGTTAKLDVPLATV